MGRMWGFIIFCPDRKPVWISNRSKTFISSFVFFIVFSLFMQFERYRMLTIAQNSSRLIWCWFTLEFVKKKNVKKWSQITDRILIGLIKTSANRQILVKAQFISNEPNETPGTVHRPGSSFSKQTKWRRTWDGVFVSCYGQKILLPFGIEPAVTYRFAEILYC